MTKERSESAFGRRLIGSAREAVAIERGEKEAARVTRPVGEGVSELRVDYGPGYRVYFKRRGRQLVILLAGGDKSTQAKDIRAALRLARGLAE